MRTNRRARPRRATPAVAALWMLAAGCGGGATVIATTPTPDPATDPVELGEPAGALPVPAPAAEWTPQMYGGEAGEMLARALADTGSLMMMLGPRADAAFEDRVFQMVKAASPEAAVVARERGTLDKLLEERGEIPYRVTLQPAGTDVLGRPYYLPKEHPLHTEWLEKKKALEGAEGMLTVRRVRVDDQKLRELRKRRRGGCGEILGELRRGLDESTSFFAPLVEGADAALERAFGRHLDAALPFWRDELAAARGGVAPGSEGARCLDAYADLVERYAVCADRSCELAPRLHLTAGGVVGADRSALDALPDRCPAGEMRDFGLEVEEMLARAVDEVLPTLNGPWSAELQRREGLERVADGLEDFCALRHRRIAVDDLERARADVREFLERLGDRDLDGEWYPSSGLERIPGQGPVRVLARVRAVGADPGGEAADLVERLRRLERCKRGGERTYQASLIDVGTSEVRFMGIFFEEQLLCEDLAPGSP